MLKFAHELSDDYEYAIIWWGQSNAQPQGVRSEGLTAAPHLTLPHAGGVYATTHVTDSGSVSVYTVSSASTEMVGHKVYPVTTAAYAGTVTALGYLGTVIATTTTTISVRWTVAPGTPSSVASVMIVPPDSAKRYDSVRVLTPFMPEAGDGVLLGPSLGSVLPSGTPSVGGYTFDVDSWADVGLFLPYSYLEGASKVRYISSAVFTGGSPTTVTVATHATNAEFVGGRVLVRDSASALGYAGTIIAHASGSSDTFNVVWDGAEPPNATYAVEIRVPTPWDSPYAELPGFRYPNNTAQPARLGSISGVLAPGASREAPCYVPASGGVAVPKFGAMLEFAWRLSQELGRRVNVIDLSWNGAALLPCSARLGVEAGWATPSTFNSFAPTEANGLAARLQRLVATVAPAALRAEGGKPLRVLAIVGFQGEYEAGSASGTPQYRAALAGFYAWLRGVVTDAGLSPYSRPTKIPVVHAGLGLAWTTSFGTTLNDEIEQFALADGWAKTFDTSASGIGGSVGDDYIHFNGAGEAANGKLAADAAALLIDRAVSQASNDPGTLRLCNLALSYIGDTAAVTSVFPPDGSPQAAHCSRFYPVARDSLLESGQWSFASRRVALTQVTNTMTEWAYAYAVPADLLAALVVTPVGVDDDYRAGSIFDSQAQGTFSLVPSGLPVTRRFVIEADALGNRTLYTDEPEAQLRYVSKVTDTDLYPALFQQALAWTLASMLAGTIIKGEAGAAESRRCQQMAAFYTAKATPADARQREAKPDHLPPWLADR